MSERFYVPVPLEPGIVVLHGPEAHHLAVVCRLRAGDAVCLFNGDGREYRATVAEAGKKAVTLEVDSVDAPQRELPFRLEVAVSLPKGDRAQFLVEKLTELGVSRLVPLRTARSVVHPGEDKHQKLERWVIEASKQCRRNVLMAVDPLTEFAAYVARGDGARWLAHPESSSWDRLPACHGPGQAGSLSHGTVVAVGPEGGFTDAEVEMACAAGWQCISLGPRILRVETAAIALASALALRTFVESAHAGKK
jgi:16S rRNA (uracil1498-N3)-methyltransferase